MTKIADLHKQWMEDPEYQEAYAEAEPEFLLASAIISARRKANLTQQQLADLMNVSQPLVSRLESGNQNVTFKTLISIARATGTEFNFSFDEPEKT